MIFDMVHYDKGSGDAVCGSSSLNLTIMTSRVTCFDCTRVHPNILKAKMPPPEFQVSALELSVDTGLKCDHVKCQSGHKAP